MHINYKNHWSDFLTLSRIFSARSLSSSTCFKRRPWVSASFIQALHWNKATAAVNPTRLPFPGHCGRNWSKSQSGGNPRRDIGNLSSECRWAKMPDTVLGTDTPPVTWFHIQNLTACVCSQWCTITSLTFDSIVTLLTLVTSQLENRGFHKSTYRWRRQLSRILLWKSLRKHRMRRRQLQS